MSVRNKEYSSKEVAMHNTRDDLWLTIKDGVYNVTGWVDRHPGSDLPLVGLAGKDASSAFLSFHNPKTVAPLLKVYRIGVLTDYKESPLTKDFNRLRAKLHEEGLYDTDYTFYYKLIPWYIFLYALTVILLFSENVFLVLCGGLCLGFYWQQVAFLGHDCGHNSVTHVRKNDWWLGAFVTLAFGISGQWWKRNHNTHHIFPNSIEWDSNIQHLPLLAIDGPLLSGYYSYYHKKDFKFNTIAAFLVRFQYITVFPIMAIARFGMLAQSLTGTLNTSLYVPHRKSEAFLQLGYWVQVLYLLYTVPTWPLRIAVILLSHGFCGILHCQITLNHFAMPTYSGTGYEDDERSERNNGDHFLKVQLETTCDVGCEPWFDWFHGGLQFQTIHHMLPRLPRHNLRKVKEEYVLPFCKKHGLNYITTPGFLHTCGTVVDRLYKQSMEIRNGKTIKWDDSFLSQILQELLTA